MERTKKRFRASDCPVFHLMEEDYMAECHACFNCQMIDTCKEYRKNRLELETHWKKLIDALRYFRENDDLFNTPECDLLMDTEYLMQIGRSNKELEESYIKTISLVKWDERYRRKKEIQR